MIKVGDYVKIQPKRHYQNWYDDESYQVIDSYYDYVNTGVILILDRNLSYFKNCVNDNNHKYNEIREHIVDLDINRTREEKIKSILND